MFRQLLYYLILFLKCYDGIKVYFMYFNVGKCNLTLLTMRCKRYTCGHCCLKHHANNLEGRCRKGSNGGDSTLLSSKEVTMATKPQSTSQAPVSTSVKRQLKPKHMAMPLQTSLEPPKYPRQHRCIGLVLTLPKLYLASFSAALRISVAVRFSVAVCLSVALYS